MSQTTGSYEQVNGNPVVRFERTFPHSVPAVWDAITDPEQLEAWFPTTVEFSSLSAGSAIEFRFADDAYPPMTGEVREIRDKAAIVEFNCTLAGIRLGMPVQVRLKLQ